MGDGACQSAIVPAPDGLPDNHYSAAIDPAFNVVETFGALQEACCEANGNVPSTVVRALGGLSDLVKNTPRCVFCFASQYRAQESCLQVSESLYVIG